MLLKREAATRQSKRADARPRQSLKVLREELGQLIERDHVHLVVKINVIGARDNHELFRLRRSLVRSFAKITRVGLLAMNQQHWPGRYFRDVGQERHVHEGQRIGHCP